MTQSHTDSHTRASLEGHTPQPRKEDTASATGCLAGGMAITAGVQETGSSSGGHSGSRWAEEPAPGWSAVVGRERGAWPGAAAVGSDAWALASVAVKGVGFTIFGSGNCAGRRVLLRHVHRR